MIWSFTALAVALWNAASISVVCSWSSAPLLPTSAGSSLMRIRHSSTSSSKIARRQVSSKTALFSSQSISASNSTTTAKSTAGGAAWVSGPDLATKPDYGNIHGPLGSFMDNIFLRVFRGKLAEYCGFDSKMPQDDYDGLIELTAAMNSRYSNRTEVQQIAQTTLRSLFPSWMPPQFAILFSKPFPEFSSRLNAWATMVGGTWLMGECEVNDVVTEDGTVLKDQGLLVKRCRFLEESGCASICVNSCKIPTQNFSCKTWACL